MLKLCYKDYLACRLPWLLMVLVFVLYAASPMGWESLLYMLMGAALVLGGLVVNAILEDRYKTEILYLSLPVSRAAVVGAKYLAAGMLSVAYGALVFGGIPVLARIVPPSQLKMDPRIMVSIDGAACYLVVAAALTALFLPFYLGFGLGRGSALFSAAFLGLSLVLYAVHRILAATRPGWEAAFQINPGRDVGAVFIGLIASLRALTGTPLFILIVVLAIGLPVGFSLGLSIRLYERREF